MSEVDLAVQYYNELFIPFVFAFVAVIFVIIIPGLYFPFDRFFTMIHELGHVIMTGITNGVLLGFQVFFRGGGVSARKPGTGSNFWIKPAGYLGVSFFSAGLILLAAFPQFAPIIIGTLGMLILCLVAAYGRKPKSIDEIGGLHFFTALIGFLFGGIMIGIAFFAHPSWSVLFLTFLGLLGAFAALKALKDLALQVRINQVDPKEFDNIDPVQMAKLFPKIPLLRSPMFWVRTWSLISILLLGGAIWFTWLQNLVLIESA